MPRLFTAWFRVNIIGSIFKVGPAALPRYGVDGDSKDSLDDIKKALTDCEDPSMGLLFGMMGRDISVVRPRPASDSEEGTPATASTGAGAYDWRAKKLCRFFGTAKGCRNANCPFKHP